MSRTEGKDIQSLSEAYSSMYRTEEAESEVQQLNEQGTGRSALNRGAFRERNRQAQERARIEADRRIQAAGGGAAAEKAELERLRKGNVRSSSSDRRFRPRSEQELIRQARYNVRQQGRQNLKNNPDFQAPEKASASKPADTTPVADTRPAPRPASQVVLAKKDGVEGKLDKTTGKFTAGNFTDAERARYGGKPAAPAPAAPAPAAPANNAVDSKAPAPAAKPVPTGTTASGQKFERRLPTMAELRAAQSARAAARKSGADSAGQEAAAVKGGVQQAQRQASVDAAIKSANRPEALNRQAPAGSALRAQQDRLAAKSKQQANAAAAKVNTAAARPTPTAAAKPAGGYSVPAASRPIIRPKPVAAAAPKSAASAAAPVAKPAPKPAERRRMPEELDIFDTLKGEIIGEGYSEEDAMYIMANLDAEQKELVMNEGIRALMKGAVKVGKKSFGKKAATAAKSAIRSRADDAVGAQRGGFAGDADEFNQLQQGVTQSLNKLARQERRGGRGAAALNAKNLEGEVKLASTYGPQFPKPGSTYGARIEKPKPTGGKVGVEIPKQSSLPAQPPSYKEIMAKYRKDFEGKTQSEKDKIFNEYIKRWRERNK